MHAEAASHSVSSTHGGQTVMRTLTADLCSRCHSRWMDMNEAFFKAASLMDQEK